MRESDAASNEFNVAIDKAEKLANESQILFASN